MPKHHSEDYKISAVKHYLEKTNNLTATCKEFDCSRISLGRWVDRYLLERSIKRHNRLPVSYKIRCGLILYKKCYNSPKFFCCI